MLIFSVAHQNPNTNSSLALLVKSGAISATEVGWVWINYLHEPRKWIAKYQIMPDGKVIIVKPNEYLPIEKQKAIHK